MYLVPEEICSDLQLFCKLLWYRQIQFKARLSCRAVSTHYVCLTVPDHLL
jgi:hypothetical protein